jgi:hypothetical protein
MSGVSNMKKAEEKEYALAVLDAVEALAVN